MKEIYQILVKDWKFYPFRLKYTKKHELLVQFLSPEVNFEEKEQSNPYGAGPPITVRGLVISW